VFDKMKLSKCYNAVMLNEAKILRPRQELRGRGEAKAKAIRSRAISRRRGQDIEYIITGKLQQTFTVYFSQSQ